MAPPPTERLTRFAVNALWGVLSVAVNLVAGLLMAPYLIRKLGTDGYGVWSLIFLVAGYLTFFDLGFRSAVVNYTARALTTRDHQRINELLNTGLAYSGVLAALMLVALIPMAPYAGQWLGIDERFRSGFGLLFYLVGSVFAVSFPFTIVSGCIEGFQHFSALRRWQTLIMGLRTLSYVVALWADGALLSLVLCTFVAALVLCLGYAWMLRRVFPQWRLERSLIRRQILREMFGYGVHTNTNTIAMLLLQQTPPVLISRALTDAAVGFFTLPLRIAQIPLGIIRTVTDMLNPLTAEFSARRENHVLEQIAVLGNRYSFVLYAPVALLMLAWGSDIVRLWLGQEYALNAGPLMGYFTLSTWFALAGQGAAVGVLFGIHAHRWAAWGLLAEAAVVIAATALTVHQGLVTIAVWACGAMVANRTLLVAWALCRELRVSLPHYLWSIFGRPSLIAVPVYAVLAWMGQRQEQKTWWNVFAAAAAATALYLLPAFFLCVEVQHRRAVFHWARSLGRKLGLWQASPAA